MTLRYSLFGKPGNLSEVTDLLKYKQANSVKMEFGEGCLDLETQMNVPACDYTAKTPRGELKFQYLFIAKSSPLQWMGAIIPVIGDASILNYESRQDAFKKLQEQRRELSGLGIESTLAEA